MDILIMHLFGSLGLALLAAGALGFQLLRLVWRRWGQVATLTTQVAGLTAPPPVPKRVVLAPATWYSASPADSPRRPARWMRASVVSGQPDGGPYR